MKIKLDKADKIFSKFIRERADWKCEYCGKDYRDNPQGLHCSHYWGRGREGTRFEPDNCAALCFYHHRLLGHGDARDEYKQMMIDRLGQKRFDELEVQARTYCKRDRKMSYLIAKGLLDDLQKTTS